MTTLDRFISYLRDELRYSPHTVAAYRRDIESWLSSYGTDREVALATAADIRSFIAAEARAGKAISTLRRKTVALRSLFTFLMKADGLRVNPVAGLNPGRLPKRLPVNIRPEETGAMLDAIAEEAAAGDTPADASTLRSLLIMEMLYETGMRCSELIDLRDDRVDTRRREMRVTGKRNKERVIPFGENLATLIDTYREARGATGGTFFVRDDGRPLYRKMVYNTVHTAMAEAGVHARRMSPHVLRHSFATDMLSGGASLNSVQKLLGHASLATTQIYTHISLEELRKNYTAAHPRANHS